MKEIYGVGSIHQVQNSLQLRTVSPSGHNVIYIVSSSFSSGTIQSSTLDRPFALTPNLFHSREP